MWWIFPVALVAISVALLIAGYRVLNKRHRCRTCAWKGPAYETTERPKSPVGWGVWMLSVKIDDRCPHCGKKVLGPTS